MPVSALNIARENARQVAADDDRFFRNFVYFFELRLPEEVTGPVFESTFIFPLVLNPENIQMDEPFTVVATPTQGGGLFVEENGIVQRTIRIAGNTGFKPRPFRGQSALAVLSPERKSFSRALSPIPLADLSGQRHMHYLQDALFRSYADFKKDPALAEETKLIFHNQKDQESWLVAPQNFSLTRSAGRNNIYDYNIELLVLDKADAVDLEFSEDKNILDAVKDAVRFVKSGLDLAAGALQDLTAIAAEIENTIKSLGTILNGVSTVLNAASDFVEGVTDIIETPLALLEQTNVLIDDALSTYDTLLESGAAITSLDDRIIQKFREMGDGLDRIGTHPQAFQTPTSRRIAEIKARQDLLSVTSDETQAQATTPPTLADYSSLGTAPTAGEVGSADSDLGVGGEVRAYTGARQIVLGDGDTLVNLAARFLNDARRWQEIAILNGLQPPFTNQQANIPLTEASEEALPGVAGIGSQILVPNFSRPPQAQAVLPVLGARPDENFADQLLGRDLELEVVPNKSRPGSLIYDVAIDTVRGSQDAKTTSGVANLGQALLFRITTEKGTDILYKRMGLGRIIGLSDSSADLETARFRFIEALNQDPRVARVRSVSFVKDGDVLEVDADCEVRGFQQGVTITAEV